MSLSYRTGPYAVNGIPLADGYADYLTLLNERDGGIGGVPVNLLSVRLVTTLKKALNAMKQQKAKAFTVYEPLSQLVLHISLFQK